MPPEQIWLHPEAIREARAAREWYNSWSDEVAEAFMTEMDSAIEEIGMGPRHWPNYLGQTRRYLLRRFPFFVVFREANDRIEILAVAHARRRPGYWLGR